MWINVLVIRAASRRAVCAMIARVIDEHPEFSMLIPSPGFWYVVTTD